MNIIEIIILILIVCLIVLVAILLFRMFRTTPSNGSGDLKSELQRIEQQLQKNFGTLTDDQKRTIEKWAEAITKLDGNQQNITNVNQRLNQLMELSNNHQMSNSKQLIETINKIEASTKSLDALKTDVNSLNNIFYSQKRRGTLGEFSLESILTNVLGENKRVWDSQVELYVENNDSRKGRIDAMIYTGKKSENIAIDAKFPLEAYLEIQRIISDKGDVNQLQQAKKTFEKSIKDKLLEIKKYFNPKNQISNAILFVPSEAIFTYIVGELQDTFENTFQDHIWICSPTTLSAVLYIVLQARKDYEMSAHILEIKKLIAEISKEYLRFDERWEALKRKIIENRKEVENLDITLGKIKSKQAQMDLLDDSTLE